MCNLGFQEGMPYDMETVREDESVIGILRKEMLSKWGILKVGTSLQYTGPYKNVPTALLAGNDDIKRTDICQCKLICSKNQTIIPANALFIRQTYVDNNKRIT